MGVSRQLDAEQPNFRIFTRPLSSLADSGGERNGGNAHSIATVSIETPEVPETE